MARTTDAAASHKEVKEAAAAAAALLSSLEVERGKKEREEDQFRKKEKMEAGSFCTSSVATAQIRSTLPSMFGLGGDLT